ncbi:MAG: hypothetical protein Q4G52_10105 [Clostridia bacterium]|nr:hypothetical protein [Clostridia bacterium]
MNTLMADARTAYKARSKYTSAGYSAQAEGEAGDKLYIPRVPAGSKQEDLIDLNRLGYRAERPWRDTPDPLFEQEEKKEPEKKAPAAPRRKARGRQGLLSYLEREAKKAKRDAALCVLLFSGILVLVAAWGQKMVEGVSIQNDIARYEQMTVALLKENESLTQQLEMARSGERIRNLAQNELGMLRPERAQTETIYIRTPNLVSGETAQQNEETKLEALDLLLGLLNLFHIGE